MIDTTLLDLEAIRANVTTIGYAIEKADEIANKMIESRWKYEMVRRNDALSQAPNAAGAFLTEISGLRSQHDTAVEVAQYLTGTDSMDAARQAYLDLLTAYQRVGALRELERMVFTGFEAAKKEAAEQGVTDFAVANHDARAFLATTAESIALPALSDLAIAGEGSFLLH